MFFLSFFLVRQSKLDTLNWCIWLMIDNRINYPVDFILFVYCILYSSSRPNGTQRTIILVKCLVSVSVFMLKIMLINFSV